jgi:hypothetical protein
MPQKLEPVASVVQLGAAACSKATAFDPSSDMMKEVAKMKALKL